MDSIVLPTPWQERFTRERQRLLDALGALTDGGIVEALQPIGSLSFNVTAGNAEDSPEQGKATGEATGEPQPRLDIGLAVWPFPLQASERTALEAIGYAPVPDIRNSAGAAFSAWFRPVPTVCRGSGRGAMDGLAGLARLSARDLRRNPQPAAFNCCGLAGFARYPARRPRSAG